MSGKPDLGWQEAWIYDDGPEGWQAMDAPVEEKHWHLFRPTKYIRADVYYELEKGLSVANELLDHYRSKAH